MQMGPLLSSCGGKWRGGGGGGKGVCETDNWSVASYDTNTAGKWSTRTPSHSELYAKDPNHQKYSVGKYNTFSSRDSHRVSHCDLKHTSFREKVQRWQPLPENAMPEGQTPAMVQESDRPLNQASGLPGDDQNQVKTAVPLAQLCKYHLAKCNSSPQCDSQCSLHSSQCFCLDGTGSATPLDSPLCAPDSTHPLTEEQQHPCHSPPNLQRDIYLNADATLLCKILPNLHPNTNNHSSSDPVFGAARDGSHRMPKIKETTV
ncbi:hypothetical protein AGOR_G00068110 [Albula goreensis]|uniref:Uncharacterized protein n=1 Tax=Albula goreensis TaxID=1534307 RepID=A0A8T3DP95_9TELE|nr:hypothetical protein AGOR_G00068110 [Albula goreensis]